MLRNETAALLRRVEQGEAIRVTVHGHPVAELRPIPGGATFVGAEALAGLRGLLDSDDPLDRELREGDDVATDPFG